MLTVLTSADTLTVRSITSDSMARPSICRTSGKGPNLHHTGCRSRSSASSSTASGVVGAMAMASPACATASDANGDVSKAYTLAAAASSEDASSTLRRPSAAAAARTSGAETGLIEALHYFAGDDAAGAEGMLRHGLALASHP